MRIPNGRQRQRPRESGRQAESMDDDIEVIFEVIAKGMTRLRSRIDITVDEIREEQCAYCGLPASVSFYHLRRRERTLLCGACLPPNGHSATSRST